MIINSIAAGFGVAFGIVVGLSTIAAVLTAFVVCYLEIQSRRGR